MDKVDILNGLLAESFDPCYKQEPSSQDVVEIRMEDIQSNDEEDLSEESDEPEEEENKPVKEEKIETHCVYKETTLIEEEEEDSNQIECMMGQGESTTLIKLETDSDCEVIATCEENDTADQEPQENPKMTVPVGIHNNENNKNFHNRQPEEVFESMDSNKSKKIDVLSEKERNTKQRVNVMEHFVLRNSTQKNESSTHGNLLDPKKNVTTPQVNLIKTFQTNGSSTVENGWKQVGFGLNHNSGTEKTYNMLNNTAPLKTDILTPVAVGKHKQGEVNKANNVQAKLVPVTTNKGLIYCVAIPKDIKLNQEEKDGLNSWVEQINYRAPKRNVEECVLVSSSEDEGDKEPTEEQPNNRLAHQLCKRAESVLNKAKLPEIGPPVIHNQISSQLLGQNNQNTVNEKVRKIATNSEKTHRKEIHQMQTPHKSLINDSRQQMNLNINHGKEIIVWNNGKDSHKNIAAPEKTDILTPGAVGKYNQGKVNGANKIQGKLVPVTTNKGLIYCVVIPKQKKLSQEEKDGLNPCIDQINYRTPKRNVEECVLVSSSEDEGDQEPTEEQPNMLAQQLCKGPESVPNEANLLEVIRGQPIVLHNRILPQLLGQKNQNTDNEKVTKIATNSKKMQRKEIHQMQTPQQSLINESRQQMHLNINHGKQVLVWVNGKDCHKNIAAPRKTDILTPVAVGKYNQSKLNGANNIQGKLVPVTTNKGLIYCVVIPKDIKPNQEEKDGLNPRVEQINYRKPKRNVEECVLIDSSEDESGKDHTENMKKRKLAKNSSGMVENVNSTGSSNNEQNKVLAKVSHEGKQSKDITRENRNSDNRIGNRQQNNHCSGEQENELGDSDSTDDILEDPFDCSSSEDDWDTKFRNEDQKIGVNEVPRSTVSPKL